MFKIKKLKRKNSAVSEVMGTLLILAISVSVFSGVYAAFFSVQADTPTPAVDIVGTIKDNTLILEHRGGDSLSLDTEIILTVTDGSRLEYTVNDPNDYLPPEDEDDGKWDIGESFKLPLSGLAGFERFDPLDVMTVDVISNSLIMVGKVSESRVADLVLEYDIKDEDKNPLIGTQIDVTFIVRNDGESYTDDVVVQIDIPEGLDYDSDDSAGAFGHNTGLWNVGFLDKGDVKMITVTMDVEPQGGEMEFTQLAFIVDGSVHCTATQWNNILRGLYSAVLNSIPHNDQVELTIVQYGGTPSSDTAPNMAPNAILEIGPIVISNSNYNMIANDILSISKMNGKCPMSAGILKANDVVKASSNYKSEYKQVTCLLVAGLPDCVVRPQGYSFYKAWQTRGRHTYWGKLDALIKRDGMISNLQMTPDKDEINGMVILNPYIYNGQENPWADPDNISWLKDLAWLGSYYCEYGDNNCWPPEGPGWFRGVVYDADIVACIQQLVGIFAEARVIKAEIVNTLYMDPFLDNNRFDLIIAPRTS